VAEVVSVKNTRFHQPSSSKGR